MFKWFGLVSHVPYTKVDGFAEHLRDGRIVGSRCRLCSRVTFPPRADCAECLGEEFDFVEYSGRGTLHTYTRIEAAPTGFEDLAPYVVGVIDLEEGGRALAWFGESVKEDDIEIGMDLQLVPRMKEDVEEIRVYYSLERSGTEWVKTPERARGDEH
jgi:uncharacterized OB-fold protein